MLKYCILLMLGLVTNLVQAKYKPDPTTYPDVTVTSPPTVTIRNINTGNPLASDHYGRREPERYHWSLIDFKVENLPKEKQLSKADQEKFKRLLDGGSAIQLRVYGSNYQCLNLDRVNNPSITTRCTDYNSTVMSMIPTETGSFVLTYVPLRPQVAYLYPAGCLMESDDGKLHIKFCAKPNTTSTRGQPQPLWFQWAILPPFGPSKLLTPPTK